MQARILIVGGGVAGLATAWSLARQGAASPARRGARGIVLCEREPLLGTHSTGRNAAILRSAMPDPLLAELAQVGGRFLRAPPRGFAPTPLLERTGLAIVAAREPAPGSWLARLSLRDDVLELAPARLARLAPHWRGAVARAWWLADEGRIDVAALVEGFARGAREAGVELRLGAGLTGLERLPGTGRGFRARLADGTALTAERVVLAAGGWAGALGRALGSQVALFPTRRHLLVTEPDARVDARWPVVWSDDEGFYARPESGGLMLCGCDQVACDPDALEADPDAREMTLAKAARLLPDHAALGVARWWAGVRTLTDDGRFVLGPDPDVDDLVWCAGLGGHGISAASAVGELTAELVLHGTSASPLASELAPGRAAVRAG